MRIIFFTFFIYLSLINKSYSLIEIDITRGNLDPLPIAVSPLHVDPTSSDHQDVRIKELGDKISEIIENNFRATGLFNPLKKDAFVPSPIFTPLTALMLIKAEAISASNFE